MRGSGLFILNPPWTLHKTLQEVMPYLVKVLGRDAGAGFVLEQREKHGITVLPLEEHAVFHLHKLPALHRDPFDRMLICQAIEHDCVLLTPDPLIAQYPVRTQW